MNAPVKKTDPKANPVLYGALAQAVILIGARGGLALTNASVDEAVDLLGSFYILIQAMAAFIVRSRVKPVHSDNTDVVVTNK